jgi:hypothetical protein
MSKARVDIRPAAAGDAALLAPLLRAQDAAEIDAGAPGRSHVEVIARSLRHSVRAWTFAVEGELAFVCGVVPLSLLPSVGCPWLLGTNVMKRRSLALMPYAAEYIAKMREGFDVLENCVHVENTVSTRWLQRMGARFSERPFRARGGALFVLFRM